MRSYVIEHVLFKVAYPAEFHAQTAVEAAIRLHDQVRGRLDQIERVRIETQQSAMRIIDKRGPLCNPADRDHCLQYMVAVALLEGTLSAEHYQDEYAGDPRIDRLREKMEVVENPQYSRDYLDPDKRSIANAVQVFFADGSATPAGRSGVSAGPPPPPQPRRFRSWSRSSGPTRRRACRTASARPCSICSAMAERLESLPVDQFMAMFAVLRE